MLHRYEIIGFDNDMPVRCFLDRIGRVERHLHEYFEVVFVLSGECDAIVGEDRYRLVPNAIMSIDGYVPHEYVGSDCVIITVQFKQAVFEKSLPEPKHPSFECNSTYQHNDAAFEEMRRLIAHLLKNSADKQGGYPLRTWALIYQLMDVMYENFRIDESDAKLSRAHQYALRMAQITDIINERYSEDIALSDLADELHLSMPYLSKFISKYFGFSFLSYLTQVRLKHAERDLLATDDTVECISLRNGFPNSYAFTQAFKKEYGVLPSIYRRKNEEQKTRNISEDALVPSQHDFMAGLKKYLESPAFVYTPEQMSYKKISVDCAKNGKALKHTWRDCASVCNAHDLLISDVQKVVQRVQSDIGFEYIKFSGIFSDEMRVYNVDESGRAFYSFNYVNNALDFLRSCGLRPFIQLSFMPKLLARDTHKQLWNRVVSPPKDINGWTDMVAAFFKNIINRYGIDEISRWRFSVWDHPELPFGMSGFESDDDFFAFYKATYTAAKKFGDVIRFGTPSTMYILKEGYRNWYTDFLERCREEGCPPDFINIHYYETTFTGDGGVGNGDFGFFDLMLNEDPGGLERFAESIRSDSRQHHFEDLPVYVSEWNNTPSFRDLLNDTCFKSCYIVKSILENYDKTDSLTYHTLTDFTDDATPRNQMFFGGLGLFSAQGIPKASYFALCMVRELDGEMIGRGEGWFAVRDKGEGYTVMLYNYRHYSKLYASGEIFDMTFTDRYTPFYPYRRLTMHLNLTGLKDGEYEISEAFINRESGSAFDCWLKMGAVELNSAAEIDNLKSRSMPALAKRRVTAENGGLTMDVVLEMLEVRTLRLKFIG